MAMLVLLLILSLSSFGNLVVDFTMAQEGNIAVLASSDPGKRGGTLGVEVWPKRPRIDNWPSTSKHCSPPKERWVFGYGLTSDRRLDGWGRPVVVGPHHLYSNWFSHNNGSRQFPVPIECPDFPNVSDEDLFWLLRTIELRHHYAQPGFDPDCPFTEGEMDLFQASIILASKRALEGLDE